MSQSEIDAGAESDLQSCILNRFPAGERVYRLAVTGDDTTSDELMVALSASRRFRLIERSQLDRIISEQKLAASGLTDEEQALKIGSLLPVDLLLTGRKDQQLVRGRFFDVTTGEVLSAFQCSLADNSQPTNQNNQNVTNITTNIHIDTLVVNSLNDAIAKECDKVHAPVRKQFENLNGQSNLNAAVAQAVKVPFDEKCGRIHYDIIETFSKYELFPETYTDFLIATLNGIDSPSSDNRAATILTYFAKSNDAVEPAEWKSGIEALKRSKADTVQGYMNDLINLRRETAPALSRARIILELAEKGQIGRPVAFEPALVFRLLLTSLKFDSKDKSKPTAEFLNQYAARYLVRPQKPRFYRHTVSMLMSESIIAGSEDQTSILSAIKLIYDHQPTDRHTDERAYYDLAYKYDQQIKNETNETKRTELQQAKAQAIHSVVVPLCRVPQNDPENGYTRNQMTAWLNQNNVRCSWLASADSLIQKMNQGDWDTKVTASASLAQMGTNAKPAEQTALKYLLIKGMSRSDEIRSNCALILGNIGTTNPAAIRALIDAANDFSDPVRKAAMTALQTLDAKAVPYMVESLSRSQTIKDSRLRLTLITILGRLGKDGQPALSILRQIAASDKEAYVVGQAQIAIVNIEEGRKERQ